jgi:hypothetical protein
MKMIMSIKIPPQKFNTHVRDGSIGALMGKILEATKPEAAYFIANDGCRGGHLIVDLKDTSQIPAYAEPWFLYFDAEVNFTPYMTAEDLANAGLEEIGKKWA